MYEPFTLPDMYEDFEMRLGRELSEYESRMIAHAFITGLASGVDRTAREYNLLGVVDDGK